MARVVFVLMLGLVVSGFAGPPYTAEVMAPISTNRVMWMRVESGWMLVGVRKPREQSQYWDGLALYARKIGSTNEGFHEVDVPQSPFDGWLYASINDGELLAKAG